MTVIPRPKDLNSLDRSPAPIGQQKTLSHPHFIMPVISIERCNRNIVAC